MRQRITKERIIERLRDGWDLYWSPGIGMINGHYFIRKDGIGHILLHAGSVKPLIKNKLVSKGQLREGDRYRLTRYELVNQE